MRMSTADCRGTRDEQFLWAGENWRWFLLLKSLIKTLWTTTSDDGTAMNATKRTKNSLKVSQFFCTHSTLVKYELRRTMQHHLDWMSHVSDIFFPLLFNLVAECWTEFISFRSSSNVDEYVRYARPKTEWTGARKFKIVKEFFALNFQDFSIHFHCCRESERLKEFQLLARLRIFLF